MPPRPRIVVGQFKELTIDDLAFARQIGVDGITINGPISARRRGAPCSGRIFRTVRPTSTTPSTGTSWTW